MGEERLDRLRVVQRPVHAAAVRRADHHRHAEPVVRAVAHPRRLGHDLVERRVDEVRELDLGDRPQPVHRGADRRADDHRLGQRRVDDPVVAELGPQAVGREEHAALLADVLAQHDDRLVAAHLLGHALADRLDERPDRHQCDSAAEPWVWVGSCGWPAAVGCHGGGASLGHGSAYTWSTAVNGSGSGSASAWSVASSTSGGDLGAQRLLDLVGQDARIAQLVAEDRQRVLGASLRELLVGAVLRLLVVGASAR